MTDPYRTPAERPYYPEDVPPPPTPANIQLWRYSQPLPPPPVVYYSEPEEKLTAWQWVQVAVGVVAGILLDSR